VSSWSHPCTVKCRVRALLTSLGESRPQRRDPHERQRRLGVALQNFVMHFPVTHSTAAFATLGHPLRFCRWACLMRRKAGALLPSFESPPTVWSTSPTVKLMVCVLRIELKLRALGRNSNAGNSRERGKRRTHDNRPPKRPLVLVHQFADLTIAEVKAQNKNQVP
jgi:hypothetical protein